MGIGRFGHELSRRNLLSQVEHFGFSEAEAAAVIDEVAGWAPELEQHYREHLLEPELRLAMAAMGADKLLK